MARALLKNYLGLEGQGEVTVNNEELFAAFEQVDQAQQVVDEVETDIDSLEASSQGLESIVEDLQASLENGGLDTTAAAFAEHAVTAHVQPLGLEGHSIVPSLESFGGYTGREASTQVSIEGISDTIKKIWAAIKAAVQKAIKAVADFFAKIFGGIDKVVKKLEDEKKELKKMVNTHEVKPKAEVTIPHSETLRFNGKLDYSSVTTGIQRLTGLINKVMSEGKGGGIGAAKGLIENTMDVIEKAKDAKSDEGLADSLQLLVDGHDLVTKTYEKLETDIVTGDKVYQVVTETDKMPDVTFKLSSKAQPVKDTEKKQEPYPLPSMVNIVENTISALKDADKEKDKIKKLNDAREKAVKVADKAVEDEDKNAVYNVWEKAKSRAILKATQYDIAKPIRDLSKTVFSVGRAVISLSEATKGGYKKKDK